MAIPDTSIMNTYLATGMIGSTTVLTNVTDSITDGATAIAGSATEYTRNAWTTLTDGNIPEGVQAEATDLINTSVDANFGVVPETLYNSVAEIITPYVSGFTLAGLGMALRSNNLFGLAVSPTAVDLSDLELAEIDVYKNRYLKSSEELTEQWETYTGGSGFAPNVGGGSGNGGAVGGGGAGSDPTDPLNDPGVITNPTPVGIPPPEQDLQFKGVDGDWEFESGSTNQNITAGALFVSSVEELECEMSSIKRPISEIILHWSETFTNSNLTGLELQQMTGSGSNAYHFIIKRDGSIERGVPLDIIGDHCAGVGSSHNKYSIGVCLVGGVNVSSGDTDLYGNYGAGSITRTQYNTLQELFRIFFLQYPGGQALGHGEIDVSQDDPGFEVRDYVYNKFNKRSLYLDPMREAAKTPEEIITSVDERGAMVSNKDPDVMDKKF